MGSKGHRPFAGSGRPSLACSLARPCAIRAAHGCIAPSNRVGARLAYALQQLINGITLGMIYGLIAVGYTMVYGIIGMINSAHGDVFMVGSFLSLIALLLLSALGITSVPLALAMTLLFAAGIAALFAWTIERIAYLPRRGSFRLAPLISAIGMSITLQNFVQVSQGARVKPMNAMLPGGIQLM